jgi:hypothetical protein
MKRQPVIGTLDSHISQMRLAADKHLADRMNESERQSWAESKVAEYLRKGILALAGAR